MCLFFIFNPPSLPLLLPNKWLEHLFLRLQNVGFTIKLIRPCLGMDSNQYLQIFNLLLWPLSYQSIGWQDLNLHYHTQTMMPYPIWLHPIMPPTLSRILFSVSFFPLTITIFHSLSHMPLLATLYNSWLFS